MSLSSSLERPSHCRAHNPSSWHWSSSPWLGTSCSSHLAPALSPHHAAHPSLCSKSLTRHVVHVHVPRTKWLPSRRRKRGAGSRDRIEQTNEVWYDKRDTPYTPLREKDYCSLLPTHANSQVGLQITTIFIWLTSDIHCSGSLVLNASYCTSYLFYNL